MNASFLKKFKFLKNFLFNTENHSNALKQIHGHNMKNSKLEYFIVHNVISGLLLLKMQPKTTQKKIQEQICSHRIKQNNIFHLKKKHICTHLEKLKGFRIYLSINFEIYNMRWIIQYYPNALKNISMKNEISF